MIAGLIEGSERRAEAMVPLSASVSRVVGELGAGRDTSPTWRQEFKRDIWKPVDALDRLRLAHDDLVVLEAEAALIVVGLRAMLGPHPARYSYRDDYRRLCLLVDRRKKCLERLRLAENRLRRGTPTRPALSAEVGTELSRARRLISAEEATGTLRRARLGALLSMVEQTMAS